MPVRQLERRAVERVWGRRTLPGAFADCAGGDVPVGEIWFEDLGPAEPRLLVKYLFTSERLSIQVHPDDTAARMLGHPCGKDEAWLVLEAEPEAVIGLGLKRPVTRAELRSAALDGRIEDLIDWRPVAKGDIFYSPAGTVHAIGGGVCLIEVQQNVDLTYRLYDYGRPREVHVEEAVAAADPGPWHARPLPPDPGPGRRVVAAGPAFLIERWTPSAPVRIRTEDRGQVLVIPLDGGASLDGSPIEPGSVWCVEGAATLDSAGGADLLVAYAGGGVLPYLASV